MMDDSGSMTTPAPEAQPTPRRRRRWPWWLMGLAGLAFLFLFFLGSVDFLHYTESTAFCSVCHIMAPEVTAYENSPHARAECGTCHIGPGAVPAVQAKIANARYIWVYPMRLYEKPIPSPITSLRPVDVVCEQCHWPEKFYADRLMIINSYGQDEANSLTRTVLSLRTGGGAAEEGQGRGIHWHIANPVYYIATDEKRQEIPWVQAEYNGVVTEYLSADSSLTPEALAQYEKRKMDCVDCHNRASHNFRRPEQSIDEAMASGAIAADLPNIKQQAVAVLERKYATEAEAAQAIAGVEEYYKSSQPSVYGAREADVKAAVVSLQRIFDRSQFPFMNVDWQSHPNNIGHKDFPGCFRCHDGKHLSVQNEAIRFECNLCHTVPQMAGPGQPLPSLSPISAGEPESHRSTTWLAQHRFQFNESCAGCHVVDNPGGDDNTSFCSNGACHATEWKFGGLNAPKIRELSQPPAEPSDGQPKPIPHPIGARTDCTLCHGPDGVRPFPASHADFTVEICSGCHVATLQEQPAPSATAESAETAEPGATVEATTTPEPEATTESSDDEVAGPKAIPHELTGREECLVCHAIEGGVKPAPADHVGRTNETCQACHKPAS